MTTKELFKQFLEKDCINTKCEDCKYERICIAIGEILEEEDENEN